LKKLLILATAAADLSFLLRERAVYRAGMVKQRYFGSDGCHPTPTQIAIELMAQGLDLIQRLKNLLAKAHRNRLHVGIRPPFWRS
jgi:hypothetical protein